VLCALFATGALALTSQEADELLRRADGLKSSDPTQFVGFMQQLDSQVETLSPAQQHYLSYLRGWQFAYAGDYARAVPVLQTIIADSKDTTLRFRAMTTVANVQALATQYDEAFSQLGALLALLPEVTDKDARQQGMAVVGYIYNQVGEYDLSLNYADRIASEDASGDEAAREVLAAYALGDESPKERSVLLEVLSR
jgi:tetratricopeptide (TPR) repeat protein